MCSALTETIFVSIRFQHWRLSPEEKVSFKNAPVCYFIRNEKGL